MPLAKDKENMFRILNITIIMFMVNASTLMYL